MHPERRLEEDIAFVREAVEKRDRMHYRSIAIAVLWAVILATGHALSDFYPHFSPLFWCTATPVGYLLSFRIAAREARTKGVANRGLRARFGLHWGSLFVVIFFVIFIALSHRLEHSVMSQFITLTAGVTCFLAGLHLDRRLLVPGIVTILGAPAVDFLAPYPWTIVGLAIAASLVVSAIWMKPRDDNAI